MEENQLITFSIEIYRKKSIEKDNDWLIENKGYSLDQAISVIASIQVLQNDKINDVLASLIEKHPSDWSLFEAYTFSIEEIAGKSELDVEVARKVIESFVSPVGHEEFTSLEPV
ncbi:MAG: hypothetical protein MZV65_43335 [Chromatiales bacterium]|nr:hypothetical protein [Chromatiales bacterium]